VIRTAFVSTYPPRQCSVARFTHNLASAVGGREIVALYSAGDPKPSPLEVHHRIRTEEPEDYQRTATSLRDCTDVVAIQHDFDVWNAQDGRCVLDFAAALDVPSVATLHSVPGAPDRRQRLVLSELARIVTASVVMSRSAPRCSWSSTARTRGAWRSSRTASRAALVDAATVKPALGMAGRDVILSFARWARTRAGSTPSPPCRRSPPPTPASCT
jgi:hypothetical protein